LGHNDCELNLSYPPVEVTEKNCTYACLLLNDYAGKNGELTALTQYFYQYLITKYKYINFGETLECIAICEMRHMEMLGELIVQLGGNPLYRTVNNRNNQFWCGYNVSSTQDIIRFLKENIQAENIAIKNYEARICQINDSKIQKVLERIILDEKHHINIFSSYIDEFM
jgi:bacterioferritin